MTLGIVGAGKLGMALAQAGVEARFAVTITSRHLENTKLIAEVMAPGSRGGTLAEVAAADVVVLALPLHRLEDLPRDAFDGKVVVDAINYWQPVDGDLGRYGVAAAETSLLVTRHFSGARVVKSLNQLGYHDVEDGRRPGSRWGVAVAGDDPEAKAVVKAVVAQLGFEPVDAGTLADGARLGPGGPAFGATLTAEELVRALGAVAVDLP